jgi:hypothetical protein
MLDGEKAMYRAAQKAGSLFTLSSLSTTRLEDVAKSASSTRWFQLYVAKVRSACFPRSSTPNSVIVTNDHIFNAIEPRFHEGFAEKSRSSRFHRSRANGYSSNAPAYVLTNVTNTC